MSSSSATNSSLSSFSDECETNLPESSPPPPLPPSLPTNTTTNECVGGKKLVHKIEPIFNNDTSKMRIFLEDGSLGEYSIEDLTIAEELVEKISLRHSLGSDMRRYRLTLSEAQDASWRSIRYIRPQQKLKEVSQWPCMTTTTICTLRVVIVPSQAELLADTEPITFTYLYRQSINDYVRERAGSEMSVDIAVQLTALLILDESLCTGVRTNILVKLKDRRSWLLKQLLPRSLLDQFSLKQLIHRIRNHLHNNHNTTQLCVAKQFIRIFAENTRSFAGKLFPVKFPDKHRDSILLIGSRYPVAIIDQARRINSPVITLVSTWSHLSRVIVKQYRNGVAIRLLTCPQRTNITTLDDSSLLQQEISFLIHTNLLNDLMAFIEGYSQLESSNVPLAIERISHISKSPTSITNKSKITNSLDDIQNESSSSCRSPFVQRILSNKKYHQTYTLTRHKHSPPTSPSLFDLTRQFFTRNPAKTFDMDERETVSNVPNRTTLVTWRSIADNHTSTPPPPPVLYRTVIDVKHTEPMTSVTDDDDDDDDQHPDVIDLTTSYGYYGSLSFPIRPPSPFTDGLIWTEMANQCNKDEDPNGIVMWSPSTKQLTVHYNTNNNNNNNISHSRITGTWKRTLDRILKRTKSKKDITIDSYGLDTVDDSVTSYHQNKHVHWIDDNNNNDDTILKCCHRFVEHLKIFIHNIMNDKNEEIYLKNCQMSLDELNKLTDCSELKQAFEYTIQLANKQEKHRLLQQQTFIAHLISRTVLSC
ncbi:unnamed protein product [Adineta steineri]|uniref:FERM domain-containing protein n=4 Tax=Adineta steineri TaxID=433720 RepID=A0A814EFR1_9BILA|nr:unnamed protein product [Adineta steineri]CAF1111907.1 unnamed protein product [Adineta steineri]CAF3876235.1 unnamed protein product [Adineta steineri]